MHPTLPLLATTQPDREPTAAEAQARRNAELREAVRLLDWLHAADWVRRWGEGERLRS